MKRYLYIAFFLLLLNKTYGEIENVRVQWDPARCQTTCIQNLVGKLRAVPGVSSININPSQGSADIRWSPFFTFNVSSLKSPFTSSGLVVLEIRLRVRGMIDVSGNLYSIISLGDYTPFNLLGPGVTTPITPYMTQGSYVNPSSYPVNANVAQKLIQANRTNVVTVVEGPLVAPDRYPSTLIISNLQFSQ